MSDLPRRNSPAWDFVEFSEDHAGLVCLSDMALSLELRWDSFSLDPTMTSGGIEVAEARALCAERYPAMGTSPRVPDEELLRAPACTRGSIGAAFREVASTHRSVLRAAEGATNVFRRFDLDMARCEDIAERSDDLRAERNAFDAALGELAVGRVGFEAASQIASGQFACVASTASREASEPHPRVASDAGIAEACTDARAERMAASAAVQLLTALESLGMQYETSLERVGAQGVYGGCLASAFRGTVGLRASIVELEEAHDAFARALARLDVRVADAQRLWGEARGLLLSSDGAEVSPAAGDAYVPSPIRNYLDAFRVVRRHVQLAVRAAEYEQQVTLPDLRQAVQTASNGSQLQSVLTTIQDMVTAQDVQGRTPVEGVAVLSLRDDVLGGVSSAHLDAAEHRSSAIERFRIALAAPSSAVYGDDGRWLGQRIPFELVPLADWGSEPGSVAFFSAQSCAERVWSVTASLVGEQVNGASEEPSVALELQKEDVAFSRWCQDGQRRPFQSASVRPGRQFFVEPDIQHDAMPGDIAAFSRTPLRAFVNAPAAELEQPAYAEPESREFAGRGLFGRYALFIPAALIAAQRDDGSYSDGLVLDRVDDVLLRLEYTAVPLRR